MTDTKTATGHVPGFVHLVNRIVRGALRIGMPMGPMILLTVRGRKTGLPRTTPVGLFEWGGHRYLFSTFGDVQWVRNLRATHEAIVSHGRRQETVVAVELVPEEAAPVLKGVLGPLMTLPFARGMLRSWYGVTADMPLPAFIDVARQHPVFALGEVTPALHGK